MRVRNMTEGSPIKLILAVAFPLMIGNVFQQLYTVVDAQVVGMVEGVTALAALGVSDWFMWLFFGAVHGLAQGFTIPMAQAFGAGDEKALRRNVGNAAVLSLITSVTIAVVAIALITPVHIMMNTPDAIRPISRHYLTTVFLGFPISMAYNLMGGILRSLGDGRSPLYAMIVASIVNIVLDLLFVAVFHMGVVGAALATVIAQVFSCLFCFSRLRHLPIVHPSKQDLCLHGPTSARLIKLGLPIAAQNGVIGLGGMFVQSIVNSMGVTFIAGYTATNKLYGVLDIASVSYGYAVSTYAGQNLGAKKTDRIRKGVHSAAFAGILTAAFISTMMFLFGHHILGSFLSGTPEEVSSALKVAVEFLHIMCIFLPILYLLHIYRSALQGMGNTFMPMISGLVELGMRMGAAFLLPGLIGYQGLFFAEILAWFGADVILISSYYVTLFRAKHQFAKEPLQEIEKG
ncbi:MAG: MATE family efflux transporter [Clostridiales bacterium]|nr:MATE family efflux transporter [Clostridiales bacterium]